MGGCSTTKKLIVEQDNPHEKMPFASFVRIEATHAIQACKSEVDKEGK